MLVILFILVFEYTYFCYKLVFEYLQHSLPWPYFHIYINWSLTIGILKQRRPIKTCLQHLHCCFLGSEMTSIGTIMAMTEYPFLFSFQHTLSDCLINTVFEQIGFFPILGVDFCMEELIVLCFPFCDAPKPGCSLTTRQPAEYSWMSGNPTPFLKIVQSLLCTGSSTQTTTYPNINIMRHVHE